MASPTDGFADFAAAESRRLLGLAFAMTGNPHDAWDLAQETLVRLRVRWARLRDENPSGYATTVLTRLNIDRVRRLRRELLLAGDSRTERPEVVEYVGHGAEEWLLRGLGTLSARQRSVLALRFVEDLELEAIADRLDCSVGTVKSHLSRGLQRLREYAPEGTRNAGRSHADSSTRS